MKEIEIKILEISPVKIRNMLKKNKAKFVKRVLQKNNIYSNFSAKRKKTLVRLRQEGSNCWLTVKGPKKIINNHKVRKEYEMKIKSFEFGEKMLNLLGFKKISHDERKREYYKLKSCSVEIIKLPKIPIFLEIEGNEKNILKVANLLGYSEKDYFNGHPQDKYKIKDKFLEFEK